MNRKCHKSCNQQLVAESCHEEARLKKEEKRREEEEGGQETKMDNEVIRGIIAGVPHEADVVGGGVTRNTASAELSTHAGEDSFKNSELGVGQGCFERSRLDLEAGVGFLPNRRRFWRRRCYGLV